MVSSDRGKVAGTWFEGSHVEVAQQLGAWISPAEPMQPSIGRGRVNPAGR